MEPESLAVAPLSPADVEFMQGLREAIREEHIRGNEYRELLLKIADYLDHFEDSIKSAVALDKKTGWGTVGCIRTGLVLRITGPAADDDVQVSTSSEAEAEEMVSFPHTPNSLCCSDGRPG